ncbi:aminotransferase class I/II-fold pyridoxal phosphate-dependent enzyme [Mycobacterium sp. CBMA293]|uniref:DegT/DnrJ/EryC1/StrS family aminotransferase n=2 Tax=Mycolicibacterium TaxID=1866885 RepID=UPI0012DD4F46|nr:MULTISPECIES: aminotransferase class I/II-fold pyridoxal phosphate-dependent enzyme [unclassified Mycolicibacterium]MUL46253.1 aminotransferase class I/II-fold pyridoxal phosphate-dependent enzyme [Mycolicibacterium sp. CBMA 360]MUL58696.1 aminotransferase class I/II-fold pyridoxal phosphate-dependent enzyme [Mycolicibacterium sp. CBMA 335]MUL69090.1 aminotransferase class I/II-fold pyridoxal phosphate-dependent enzyme [Mycolicibacterium sp. CBMA 311]MUL97256.1 aminotransferase class I/II-fo
MSRIYLSAPDVGPREEELCVAALRSGWVAPLGPMVDSFEEALADRCDRRYAVALSSGSAALHLALLGLGVGPEDVVVVPTMTFAATANAVVYTGATPIFVDCDPIFGNLDPALLDDALRSLAHEGHHVAAVIAVDLLGHCADYRQLATICESAGVVLLSDAAEAVGAGHGGRPAGSFGMAAVLSFNGNKVISTSGGGALLTDDERLAARVRYLSTQARAPVAHYEHTEIGYNYRLSNILAALGLAQLERLPEMLMRRRQMREGYRQIFADIDGVQIFQGDDDAEDNCWLTAILVDSIAAEWKPEELSAVLAAADIENRPLWKPMHQQPVFAGARAFLRGDADRLFATGLALPSGSALSADQVDRVHAAIRSFLSAHPDRGGQHHGA